MNYQEASQGSNFSISQFQQSLCISGRYSQLLCLNRNCQKQVFICNDSLCQCYTMHKKCLHISTKTINQIILDKVISLQPLEEIINQRVDKIIDDISIFRQKTLEQIKNNFILFGLSESQRQFLTAFQNGKFDGLTGKKLWEMHLNLQKQKQLVKSLQQATKDIIKILNQFTQSSQVFSIKVDEIIQKLRLQSQYFFSNRNCKKFQASKILKTHEEQVKIQIFFGKLKLKSAQLLYRASENYFDVQKFHLKCDNIPHTLTICETEFGKIVGGYTPIPWQTLQDWVYAKDQTSCSFIFSLSNNDRFFLQQPSRAVIHRNDFAYGPQFGGGSDLIISDKANINSQSFSRINTSYLNPNYQLYEKQSYKKFSGSETEFFRIKDWEVWKIDFQDSK